MAVTSTAGDVEILYDSQDVPKATFRIEILYDSQDPKGRNLQVTGTGTTTHLVRE